MSSNRYITNNFNPNTTSDSYLQRMMNRCNQNVIDTQNYLSSKSNQSSTFFGNHSSSHQPQPHFQPNRVLNPQPQPQFQLNQILKPQPQPHFQPNQVLKPQPQPQPYFQQLQQQLQKNNIHNAPVKIKRNYKSAGTIIIEQGYNRRNGKTCDAIFLGFNNNRKMYELFYGKRDTYENNELTTARRETKEESSNMFRLSENMYNIRYSVNTDDKHYAFVIRVSAPKGGIQSNVFRKNQKQLYQNNAPHEWLELTDITRIDIGEAIQQGILHHMTGNFTMNDVYGNRCVIFARDAEFIADALRNRMHQRGTVNQLSFVKSWNDPNKPYLNGTSVYM